jgi:hypothetical protein
MRRAAPLLGGLLLACTAPERLAQLGGPEDLRIVAVVTAGGRVRVAERVGPDTRLAVGNDERLVVWRLPRADLIGPDGRPLPEASLDGLVVRLDRDEAPEADAPGGCGRCLVTGSPAPWLVHPGDRCPPPLDAESSDPALAAQVRLQVRLEWPGPCACAPPPPSRGEAVDVRVVEPEDGWVFTRPHIARSASGALLAASHERLIRWTPPPERARASMDHAGQAWCSEVPRLEPTVPIESAALLDDGRAVLVYRRHDGSLLWTADLVDEAGARRNLGLVPTNLRIYRFGHFLEDDGLEALISAGLGDPGVARCELDDERALLCTALTPEDLSTTHSRELSVARTDSGLALVVGDTSGWAFGARAPDGTWGWNAVADVSILPDGAAATHRTSAVGVGRWAVVCDVGSAAAPGLPARAASLVRAALTATAAVPGASPPVFTRVFVGESYGCSEAFPVAGRPGARALEVGGEVVVLDPSGRVEPSGQALSAWLGLSRPIRKVWSPSPGELLALSDDGALFAGPAGGPYTRVYGPAERAERGRWAVAEAPDGLWAFPVGPSAERWVFDGVPTRTELSIPGAPPGRPTAARWDPILGTFWIGGDAGARPWVLRWRPGEEAEVQALPEGEPLGPVVGLAPTGDGGVVVVFSRDRILKLGPDGPRDVPIDWDDPLTPGVESRPPVAVCGARRLLDDGDAVFRAVDGVGPVAWVAGCDHSLLRVVGVGPAPRAQRVSLLRPRQSMFELGEPPDLTAIGVSCPDRVLVAARGRNELESEKGRIWQLRPEPPPDPSADERAFEGPYSVAFGPNDDVQSGFDSISVGRPLALLSSGGRTTVVFSLGSDAATTVRRFGARRTFWFGGFTLDAAQDARGDVLVGGDRGRVLYGRRCGPP